MLRLEGWMGFVKSTYEIFILYLYVLICKIGIIIVFTGYSAMMITGSTQTHGQFRSNSYFSKNVSTCHYLLLIHFFYVSRVTIQHPLEQ